MLGLAEITPLLVALAPVAPKFVAKVMLMYGITDGHPKEEDWKQIDAKPTPPAAAPEKED